MGANSAAWARIMRERLDLDLAGCRDRAGDRGWRRRAVSDGRGAHASMARSRPSRRIAADHPVGVASSAHRAVIDAALEATALAGTFAGRGLVRRGRPTASRLPTSIWRPPGGWACDPGSLPRRRGLAQRRPGPLQGSRHDRRPRPEPQCPAGRGRPPTGRPRPRAPGRPRNLGGSEGAPISPNPLGPHSCGPGRPARGGGRSATGFSRGVGRGRSWCAATCDQVVDGAQLPTGPAIYCFNHMSWADPFILMATAPHSGHGCGSSVPRKRTWAQAAGGRRHDLDRHGHPVPSPARTTSSRRPDESAP